MFRLLHFHSSSKIRESTKGVVHDARGGLSRKITQKPLNHTTEMPSDITEVNKEMMDLVPCRTDVLSYKSNPQLFSLPSFLAKSHINNSAECQLKTSLLVLPESDICIDLIKLPKVF